MGGCASEQYERVTWYGYERDPTPVAVGRHRVHARRPRPQTVPHHGRVIKDELWEAAKEEEMKIPWKDANEGLPVSEEQYQERFWRRRLDGIGLDTATKECS